MRTAITSALRLQLLLRVAGVRVGADVLHRVRHALHSARRVAAHLPQGLAHPGRGESFRQTAASALEQALLVVGRFSRTPFYLVLF